MWTGTTALRNIDSSLQTLRNDAVRLDQQLSQLTGSLAGNQRRRLELVRDIARVRLSEIEQGELPGMLTAADHDAAEILQQRDSALHQLEQRIDDINARIADLEQQRESILAESNDVSQQLVDLEQRVQEQLKSDQRYLVQFDTVTQAESVALEASEKVEQAQADMAEKARPYQADPLFMYLWERGWGTTQYKAGFFSRFMDGWVARVIKYEPARVNYWNLMEIPQRLGQHADHVARIADEALMALQQLELDALAAAGAKEIEQRLESLQADMDQLDDQLEGQEQSLDESLQARARFASGEDDYIQRSVNRLVQALEHQGLDAVHRYVRDTHSPTDDGLVFELQGIDRNLEDLQEDLQDVRRLHDNKLSRLRELERVRRDFKDSRFDDLRSGFENQSLLASALAEFLQGVVSGADLWRVIKRNQRYRDVGSIPDFGSGGFGGDDVFGKTRRRSHRRSSWNMPKPRRGGGGFKMPRSSGRSGGGGFRTGGGF